jgi:hypothetical protein
MVDGGDVSDGAGGRLTLSECAGELPWPSLRHAQAPVAESSDVPRVDPSQLRLERCAPGAARLWRRGPMAREQLAGHDLMQVHALSGLRIDLGREVG